MRTGEISRKDSPQTFNESKAQIQSMTTTSLRDLVSPQRDLKETIDY